MRSWESENGGQKSDVGFPISRLQFSASAPSGDSTGAADLITGEDAALRVLHHREQLANFTGLCGWRHHVACQLARLANRGLDIFDHKGIDQFGLCRQYNDVAAILLKWKRVHCTLSEFALNSFPLRE